MTLKQQFQRSTFLAGLAVCLATLGTASAQTITITTGGQDPFQTSSGAYVDLSSYGLGTVNLQGYAFGSDGTDTVIQRTQGGTVQVGGQALVLTTSIYAVSMKSTAQVNITPHSSPTWADLYVVLNNSQGAIPSSSLYQPPTNPAPSPSTGTITITATSSSGGTFNSDLYVNAVLVFVTPNSNPTVSSNILETLLAPQIEVGSTGSTWAVDSSGSPSPSAIRGRLSASVNKIHASSQLTAGYTSGGFKVTGIKQHKGPHPVIPCWTCCRPAQTQQPVAAGASSQQTQVQSCTISQTATQ